MAPAAGTATGSASGGSAVHDDAEAVELGHNNLIRRRHPGADVEDEADDRNVGASAAAGKELAPSSVEQAFADQPVPSWREQLTVRAFVVGALLSVVFNVILMKIDLTTGINPSLNVCASLLSYFLLRTWTRAIGCMGLLRQPFTRQENTMIQTCVVSAYGITFTGGFSSYLFGMSAKIANKTEVNDPQDIKDPHLGWMMGFMFLVSFLGLFALVPLRKVMIVDYKLTYPSGAATAYLINGFHAPEGSERAKKQVRTLGKYFSLSFLWAFFQWFYTAGNHCGFGSFPTLGLEAYKNRFFFDFSPTYIGVGMICPYIVNVSLLLGGIMSWGIMWPLISTKKGSWYPETLPDSSLHGLHGYRVFLTISVILGDGLYNILKVLYSTIEAFVSRYRNRKANTLPVSNDGTPADATTETESFDDKRRLELFTKDQIPKTVALGGYVVLAAITIGCLPLIIPQLKWYHILVAYIVSPALAFCNAYGCGLTNWSFASAYGKLAIFSFGAWAGASHSGVIVALAACGVMMSIVGTAADLMQDFKTGYLTLASPRSMFISQVIGTAMGCVIAPCVFWLFYKSFDVGATNGAYPAPYTFMYRNMAIMGVDGLSLPKHCLTLSYIFFAAAFAVNMVKDLVPKKVAKFIPIPMAVAIPFYVGAYFTIDMFLGCTILFIWEMRNKAEADSFGPAVASGCMCGDGLWALPEAILSLANVKPPICMKFLSRT
uniref:Metal-nicotianamine transporter YSL7 n=1 Tax=Zea mays TaxID=4577 RepID=A0A804MDB0_MAIZE